MPFREASVVEERLEFVTLACVAGANVRSLCRRFGISPTTGYKWLARWQQSGSDGLTELSRRPHGSPLRYDAATEAAVLAVRAEHPAWGGRKIARRLKDLGHDPVPAASTVTAILRRHGVQLGAMGGGEPAHTRFEHEAPNALWQMDFKGHVALADGRLHPLTVLDDHSRFAVVLAACADQRTGTVRRHLIDAFTRYGLPQAVITDNGSPWGNGPGSPFTPLGVWLIEQDIRISHSRPYHPQTLGKDERFHRSLKAEALSGPPFADIAAAGQSLERWRHVYNYQRPHEALGLAVPASRYRASRRDYVANPHPFDYAPGDILRKVQQGGRISLFGRTVRLPKAFRGKTVALRQTQRDGIFDAVFRAHYITTIDITDKTTKTVHHVPEHPSTLSPV